MVTRYLGTTATNKLVLGSSSSFAEMMDNLAVAYGVGTDTAIGGSGNDLVNLGTSVLADTPQDTVASPPSDTNTNSSTSEPIPTVDATLGPLSSGSNDMDPTYSGGSGAQISVFSSLTQIANHDTTPSAADGTLFLTRDAHGFDVFDALGADALTPGDIHVPEGFILVQGLPSSIPAGMTGHLIGTIHFDVRINTNRAGDFGGDISFTTNDPDNNPFTFRIAGTVTPSMQDPTRGDVDGDGKADIFWQSHSGQPAIWDMDGGSATLGAALGANPGPEWHIKAQADFDGDHKTDILWQSDSGQAAVWTMNGFNPTGGAALFNPGTTWHVVDAADFSGDGKADILWQNASGLPAIWTMNGLQLTYATELGVNPGPTWHALAAADFNGDLTADILWQNDNGQVAVWTMQGAGPPAHGAVVGDPGPAWHVIGAADFKGDGQADILLQNDDGTPAIWNMGGLLVTSGTALSNPGRAWHVTGAADFSGDGKADILWQNDNGQLAVWTMDGVTVTGSATLSSPGSDWHLV